MPWITSRWLLSIKSPIIFEIQNRQVRQAKSPFRAHSNSIIASICHSHLPPILVGPPTHHIQRYRGCRRPRAYSAHTVWGSRRYVLILLVYVLPHSGQGHQTGKHNYLVSQGRTARRRHFHVQYIAVLTPQITKSMTTELRNAGRIPVRTCNLVTLTEVRYMCFLNIDPTL